ncbi:MAG: Gfo/Idh/MocA family oxidoreductase [Candidatus Poribacteria bacterium]|jgi:predicted dehydrogenase|nr:Gfo/Idh/MocA family oxidoreductase [Candidatus Poribacteria bacterium]
MDKVRIGLVGCGGMGTRHLYGLQELAQTPFNNVELCAVCDIRRENAELAAKEAERLLGTRPEIFTDLEKMVQTIPDLTAVDVVTDPSVHHQVVCQALDLGMHVMVEKPMAITVRACHKMIEAAKRNNRKLSVAENYRRDASARLVNHLLKTGAIGVPYMALFHSLSGNNTIFITPWRHLKDKGGPIIDMGVHFTDLIRYQLGNIEEVYGDIRLIEPVRKKQESIGDNYTFYQERFKAMASEVPATAEDNSIALFKMESGATVSWIVGLGGYGNYGGQMILGTKGVLKSFGTRGGRATMQLGNQAEMEHQEILTVVDGFYLEPLAEHFFPNQIATDNVDWKIIALEYYELAEAILNDRQIEVDGVEGMKDVAAVYAIFESANAGRTVKMQEVENCQVYDYQKEIDETLGIS